MSAAGPGVALPQEGGILRLDRARPRALLDWIFAPAGVALVLSRSGTTSARSWVSPSMSRAFVNEDAGGPEDPRYDLPERDSPHYDEAAAWALIQGADQGDSPSAERATGYRWGTAELVPHVERIRARASEEGQVRVEQLARRFLRAAEG